VPAVSTFAVGGQFGERPGSAAAEMTFPRPCDQEEIEVAMVLAPGAQTLAPLRSASGTVLGATRPQSVARWATLRHHGEAPVFLSTRVLMREPFG